MKQAKFPQDLGFPLIESDKGLKAVIENIDSEILLRLFNEWDELVDTYKLQEVVIEWKSKQ